MTEKDRKRRRGRRQADLGNEIITLENVSKAYATGAPALNGVSLHINRGEADHAVLKYIERVQRCSGYDNVH